MVVVEDEINEIGEELNLSEIETNLVNNVVPKPEEFDEPSGRNAYFIRPRYVSVGRTTNFSFEFISRKLQPLKKLALSQLVRLDTS